MKDDVDSFLKQYADIEEQLEAIKKLLREYRGAVFYAQSQADIATRPETVTEAEKIANGAETLATQAITALIQEARLRGVEEILLRLKQAPPIDWIDAQAWIDSEYNRLQKKLSGGSNNE